MLKVLNWLSGLLSAVGAINWGLVAFFKFNLVEFICNLINVPGLNLVLYAIVALAGLYTLIALFAGSCTC